MRSDEEAEFASLVERQWQFGCRVAWAVLRNSHDAEDAAQEAFLRIFRSQAWRVLTDERAFVARATWRAAVDRLRQRRPAREHEPDLLIDAAPDPEEMVMAADAERTIHRLIDSLPEDLRQPLVLSLHMNSREIGEAMGIAQGTVRTRLQRARQILREKLTAMEVRRYAR